MATEADILGHGNDDWPEQHQDPEVAYLPKVRISPTALCADCGHEKRQHSGFSGCFGCDNDDFCEHFVPGGDV